MDVSTWIQCGVSIVVFLAGIVGVYIRQRDANQQILSEIRVLKNELNHLQNNGIKDVKIELKECKAYRTKKYDEFENVFATMKSDIVAIKTRIDGIDKK